VQPAVFLDRDNTLIANDGDLGDPKLVTLVDGVANGLRALREAGYRLVVVTNQAGVARGQFTEDDVDAVHQRIAFLADQQASARGLIERFYYCPYHPDATVQAYRRDHPWRKPHPGMILQAARDMGLDLSRSWMVGDQERDILAGRAAGCRTVLFSRDVELATRLKPTDAAATFTDAVGAILKHRAHAPRATVWAGAAGTSQAASLGHGPAGNRADGVAIPAPASPGAAIPGGAASSKVDSVSPPMSASVAGASDAAASRASASYPSLPSTARPGATATTGAAEAASMRQAVSELAEEIRSDRLRRSEFRFVTMLAGLCQLLAITLGLLALLQLGNFDVFAKWMMGAMLLQLLTLTLLVLDLRG
jgi:D-glycero-D-manno-heptose 1,7-bisphosphate phosphatase